MRTIWIVFLLLSVGVPALAQDSTEQAAASDFVFGMVLVGPKDDGGWSQGHYEGGLFLEEMFGARMLLQESFATADVPMAQVIDRMANQGARVIFMTSVDFEQATNTAAQQHPDVVFIQVAGDDVLTNVAPANVGNIMGQMEYAKFVMGCAAALVTSTGNIGYLGPLIDHETRRLAASAYLGARHCWQTYRFSNPAELRFRVEWVGYWFFIPEQTNNPRRQVFSMYNDDIDVVIAGIDTPTPIEVAAEFNQRGERVYATAYDSIVPCEQNPDVCIGAAFYNWGIPYAQTVQSILDGEWQAAWDWVPPNWDGFNQFEETPVGYTTGGAFPVGRLGNLQDFVLDIENYASNQFVPVSFPLWQGPLRYNDENSTLLVEQDELVNVLDVWYLPRLLEGMDGESLQRELNLE